MVGLEIHTDDAMTDCEKPDDDAAQTAASGARAWYLYVVRCADGTLYTGITTDLARRLHEHNHSARGAKYTRSRRPVALAGAWACASRAQAARDEWAFKQLTRPQKAQRLGAADNCARDHQPEELTIP